MMEKVTDQLIDYVNSKILTYSGIYVAKTQYACLASHIETVAAARGISPQVFCQSLIPFSKDFDTIINLVTVNETYFFREEKQFDFLRDQVFPKFSGKNLTIWTCCCSTGEEAISLLATRQKSARADMGAFSLSVMAITLALSRFAKSTARMVPME